MKIERIDDKTVKCFLSNEELEEYEIDYKDFVTRSDKAKEVVQEIIEQAEEESLMDILSCSFAYLTWSFTVSAFSGPSFAILDDLSL